MNLEHVRSLFPHLKTDQVYFNHAAIAPWCRLAIDRISEYTNQRSGEKIENFSNILKWNSGAKEKLGKLINAPSHRIAWVENVSNGLNILAQGLNWKTGDRVILNNWEFPSNIYPFMNLKNYGVEIDFINSDNGEISVEEIEKLVTSKTKLISISSVQFLSGYRTDLNAIGELCKSKGIIFCVDAIQSTGVIQTDVEKAKIDFLAGGTHKWLMSSQGLSYIYLTEELQSRIDQKFVGWTSVKNSWDFLDYKLEFRNTAERFQNGTINALGVAVLDSVISIFIEFGMENVEERIIQNTNYLINGLDKIGIEPILKNIPEENRAGIVSFKHEKAQAVFEELEKRNIYTAMRSGMLRISPHFYNTIDEIENFINELKSIF